MNFLPICGGPRKPIKHSTPPPAPNNLKVDLTKNDPAKLLADELMVRIFSFLPNNALLTCSRISTKWKRLSEDNSLWKKKAELLGLTETPIYKAAISREIAQSTQQTSVADPLLTVSVKTAYEFDKILAPLIKAKRTDPEAMLIKEKLLKEADVKNRLFKEISHGMISHMQLRRVGRSSWEKIKAYAKVLTDKYGDHDKWCLVAHEYLFEKNVQESLNILNTHVKGNYEKGRLLHRIIKMMCDANQVKDAIVLLKQYATQEELKDYSFKESIQTIRGKAYNTNNYEIYEILIDELTPDEIERRFEITQFLHYLVDQNKKDLAIRLISKYQHDLDFIDEPLQIHRLIEIYIRLGLDKKGWQLTFKHKDSDDLVLHVLRNVFEDLHLNDQAEKAQKLIDALPQK